MRIAILEDDVSQAELLSHWLTAAGYDPKLFDHGEELLKAVAQDKFEMLILGWNVPDLSGIDVLWRVRQGSKIPVLFCTARGDQDDIVKALREGADDYLIKPLRRMELLARMESVARRTRKSQARAETFQIENFHVDCPSRTIARDSITLELSTKDFDVAVLFLRNVGRLLSRQYIHDSVWGESIAVKSRTLDTHVSRIRTKLGLVPEHGWELKGVYGHGYRLEHVALPALLAACNIKAGLDLPTKNIKQPA